MSFLLTLVYILLLSNPQFYTAKNVLLMVADDAGLELPIYGNKKILTPNLDQLIKKSMTFEQAFTTVSSCSPSRSSILTGLPSHQNGMFGLHQGYHNFDCFKRVISLPKLLSQHNIRTGIIGKKHVGPFDVFPFNFSETEENNSIMQVGRNITKIKLLVQEFLNAKNPGPFFLYIGFHDPHRCGHTHPQYGQFCEKFGNGDEGMGVIPDWNPIKYLPEDIEIPYFVPDTMISRKEIAAQYSTISRLDQGIGVVIEALKKSNNLDNTLIIYTSDNGIPFASGRTNAYDPGMVEPLLISSPSHKQSYGKTTKQLTSLLDISPTILDWLSIKYPKYKVFKNTRNVKLTGKSLIPVLEGFTLTRKNIFFSHSLHEVTMYYPMRSIRSKRYKLIHNINFKMPFPIDQDLYLSPSFQEILFKTKNNTFINWYKTLHQYYYRPEWELFDLKRDQKELNNVVTSKRYKIIFKKLSEKLFKWQNKTADPWLCSPHSVLQDTGKFKQNKKCFPLLN